MKSFDQFLISIPGFYQEREHYSFVNLHERIHLDETGQKLIFDATASSNRPRINATAYLNNIYASMVAYGFFVGWIEKPKKDYEYQKREKDGVINGKKVANIVGTSSTLLTDYVELEREELQEVADRFFNPSNRAKVWEKIANAEIKCDENYVELNSAEREALIAIAKKIIDKRKPTMTRGQTVYYDFSGSDLTFAPNTAWAFWSLARAKDEKIWQRTTLSMDYGHKACRIVWQKK